MLQLKGYQQRVLDELQVYLTSASRSEDADLSFYTAVRRQYLPIKQLPGLPYVCIRLPTGGGKTLVASHVVGISARTYLHDEHPVVLWLVPSNTIRRQTLEALRDRTHPYRQVLDLDFNGQVTVMDVREALFASRAAVEGGALIIVSTMQALRHEDTEGLKVYENNGALMDHFTGLSPQTEAWLEQADGQAVYSLANLLRLHRPMLIVDEAHNARTQLTFEVLARFAPSCIVEFTATPAKDSNVLAHASAAQLHAEAMIKLPIRLTAHANWKQAIAEAIAQRNHLEQAASEEKGISGEYVRPILLIQAQPHSRERETLHVDAVRDTLINEFGIPEGEIRRATGEYKEIDGLNLFESRCEVRYIITVEALAEGWDCSFAYILCSVAQIRSRKAVEQILGRILRLPYARRKQDPDLNRAYAHVISADFDLTARSLVDALVENGFEKFEARTALASPSQGELGPLFPAETKQWPSQTGTPFSVPKLAIAVQGRLENLELSFMPIEWDLARCDPTLSETEYSGLLPETRAAEIYVSDEEAIRYRFIQNLHAQLAFLDRTSGWTANELALWLDHNISHPDVPQLNSSLFLRRMVDYLVERRRIAIDQLTRDRYRLRDAAKQKIDSHRQAAQLKGFQACLSAEMRPRLAVTPDWAFRFEADRYETTWYYEGRYQWQRHYYPAVGQLKDGTEESRCAVFIDGLDQVKHWVRNLVYYGFWLPTSTDRFYPDFVAELNDGRYLVVEYKGKDRFDEADAKEKRAVGELWQELSKGTGLFVMPTRGDFEAIRRAVS